MRKLYIHSFSRKLVPTGKELIEVLANLGILWKNCRDQGFL